MKPEHESRESISEAAVSMCPIKTSALLSNQDLQPKQTCVLTSNNPSPPDTSWLPHWAPLWGSLSFYSAQFPFMVLGSFFGNLPVSRWWSSGYNCVSYQKLVPRLLKVHCAALVCISPAFHDITYKLKYRYSTGHREEHVCPLGGLWHKLLMLKVPSSVF